MEDRDDSDVPLADLTLVPESADRTCGESDPLGADLS